MSGITITNSFTFKKPCTWGSSFILNCSSNAGCYVRDVHPMPLHIWIVCKRSFQKPCWWDINSCMNNELILYYIFCFCFLLQSKI
jgi:hypothetical protein